MKLIVMGLVCFSGLVFGDQKDGVKLLRPGVSLAFKEYADGRVTVKWLEGQMSELMIQFYESREKAQAERDEIWLRAEKEKMDEMTRDVKAIGESWQAELDDEIAAWELRTYQLSRSCRILLAGLEAIDREEQSDARDLVLWEAVWQATQIEESMRTTLKRISAGKGRKVGVPASIRWKKIKEDGDLLMAKAIDLGLTEKIISERKDAMELRRETRRAEVVQ